MSSTANDLAEQIRAARFDANLTQEDLASKLKVSIRTVQAWEAGVTPRPSYRRKLARFFERVEQAA